MYRGIVLATSLLSLLSLGCGQTRRSSTAISLAGVTAGETPVATAMLEEEIANLRRQSRDAEQNTASALARVENRCRDLESVNRGLQGQLDQAKQTAARRRICSAACPKNYAQLAPSVIA